MAARPHIMFLMLPLLLSALGGCAVKTPGPGLAPDLPDAVVCADLADLPQDFTAYVRPGEADVPLLSEEEKSRELERLKRNFWAPWEIRRPGQKVKEAMWGLYSLKPEKGFAENLRPYPPERWAGLAANCSAADYPNLKRRGITVRNSSLRVMPTLTPYFLNPRGAGDGFPFDYFQNSAIHIGTPVYLSHRSADGQWVLVECSFASGWVPAGDLAEVDEAFVKFWQSRPLAAITRDATPLPDASGAVDAASGAPAVEKADIGALLPQEPFANAPAGVLTLYRPVRAADGRALPCKTSVQDGQAEPLPMELTQARLAGLGNLMLGQPYGWGGMYGNRDCSSAMRDLFTPFGLWLPRNSRPQASWGERFGLSGLDAAEKERQISAGARPFLTLIGLPGHIGLYLGQYRGQAVFFHNIWGLRVKRRNDGREEEGRAVIGKAVVTTLRPGVERPDLQSPNSLLDRVEGYCILPGPAKKP